MTPCARTRPDGLTTGPERSEHDRIECGDQNSERQLEEQPAEVALQLSGCHLRRIARAQLTRANRPSTWGPSALHADRADEQAGASETKEPS